jgi:hypothetical protein
VRAREGGERRGQPIHNAPSGGRRGQTINNAPLGGRNKDPPVKGGRKEEERDVVKSKEEG